MRVFAGAMLAVSLTGATAFAAPPTLQECVAASEKGQRALSERRLREARDSFLVCVSESCPTVIRNDCNEWSGTVAKALPTVVFGARDGAGKDLFDVTVSMDGEKIATRLDGKAVAMDPGPHELRFETPGHAPVIEKILVKEGEKSRIVNVTFADASPAAASTPAETPPPSASGGHTPYPWIVVGAGAAIAIAGVVVAVTAPDRPPNCSKETRECVPLAGQSAEDLQHDREIAGRADSQPVLGYGLIGIGAAAIVGGLLWHFLEPTGEKSAAASVTPWSSGRAGGLTFRF